jgi:hypothetical protein
VKQLAYGGNLAMPLDQLAQPLALGPGRRLAEEQAPRVAPELERDEDEQRSDQDRGTRVPSGTPRERLEADPGGGERQAE